MPKRRIQKGEELHYKGYRLVYLGNGRLRVYSPEGQLLVHEGTAEDCKLVIESHLKTKNPPEGQKP